MSDSTLNAKPYERDLGVMIDEKLNFDQQVSFAVSKAKRLVAMVLHTFHSRNSKVLLPVFKSMIRPVLEYASPVWNSASISHANKLESLKRFTKRLVGFLRCLH